MLQKIASQIEREASRSSFCSQDARFRLQESQAAVNPCLNEVVQLNLLETLQLQENSERAYRNSPHHRSSAPATLPGQNFLTAQQLPLPLPLHSLLA